MKSKPTTRKPAQGKKRAPEKKEKHRTDKYALNHLAVPVNVFDYRLNKFIEVNDKYTQLLGLSRDECLAQTVEQYSSWLHASDLALIKETLPGLLREAVIKSSVAKMDRMMYSLNYRIREAGGQYRHVLLQCTVTEWDENNYPAISVNLLTDISDYVRETKITFIIKVFVPENQKWETVVHKKVVHHPFILRPSEKSIMLMMVEDHSSPHIAKVLGMNKFTVRAHWRNILAKTGCRTQQDLKEFARIEGWI